MVAATVGGCGADARRPPGSTAAAGDVTSSADRRKQPDDVGTGRLRGTKFAVDPVVWPGRCSGAECPREFRGYQVELRTTRSLPRRRVGLPDVESSIAAFVDVDGVRGFDPIGRSSRRRPCYSQAVSVDERATWPPDAGTDERAGIRLPQPGGMVRVSLSSYRGTIGLRDFKVDGRLSTLVRIRPAEPVTAADDYSGSNAQRAVGC